MQQNASLVKTIQCFYQETRACAMAKGCYQGPGFLSTYMLSQADKNYCCIGRSQYSYWCPKAGKTYFTQGALSI